MPEDQSHRFVEGVRATIEKYEMLSPGDLVVVGVSGGPDSLALLHALHSLRHSLSITLHVAHLNHRMRRVAAEEARFVAAEAERLGIPCTIGTADVRAEKQRARISLEHAARRARYRLFRQVAEATGAACVATAHTADDNVETVLLHLLRGAGTDGLAGIPPVRVPRALLAAEDAEPDTEGGSTIVRPLIDTWRHEVEAYCRALGLEPRYDASNRSRAFLRNRVRLDLLPYLQRHFGTGVKPNLHRLTRIARPEMEWLESESLAALQGLAKTLPDGLELPAAELAALPLALRRRVARAALRAVKGDPEQIGYREIERVLTMLDEERADCDLPGPVRVRKRGSSLRLTRVGGPAPAPLPMLALELPGTACTPDAGCLDAEIIPRPEGFQPPRVPRAREVFLDADTTVGPLILRAGAPGDRVTPLGMQGSKTLHRLFVDAKVPQEERARTPIVADAEGILWVAGLAIADRAKVTAHTRRLLRLRWRN